GRRRWRGAPLRRRPPDGKLQVPLSRAFAGLQEQGLAIAPPSLGEVPIATGRVLRREAKLDQSKIVEGPVPDVGIERFGGPRQGGLRQRGVADRRSGGPCVVPGGVAALALTYVLYVQLGGAAQVARLPRAIARVANPL